jgi:hypothetical protein
MIHDEDAFYFSSSQEAFDVFSVLSWLTIEWILFYNAIYFSFSKFIFKMKSSNHNFIKNIYNNLSNHSDNFQKKEKWKFFYWLQCQYNPIYTMEI